MDIQLIQYFVKVVNHGSFTRAAEVLKVPKSTLSKAVTKLEKQTGTKLLVRSTRKQSLTDAGKAFYQSCLEPIRTLEEAEKSLYGQDDSISGTIKITVPEDFEIFFLSSCIEKLCRLYPELKIVIRSTNDVVDLVGEGFDFAIRIGSLEESNLKARSIGKIKLLTVVGKQYRQEIQLEKPSDLINVRCIGFSSNLAYHSWNLIKDGKTESVKTPLVVEANQIASLYKLALANVGVTILPWFLCRDALETGELIHALPDWHYEDVPVTLVSPLSTLSSKRLKVVSDELVSAMREALG